MSSKSKPSPKTPDQTSTNKLGNLLHQPTIRLYAGFMLLVFLAWTGALDGLFDALGRAHLDAVNAAYVAKTQETLTASILLLSEVDSALNLMMTSSAGITFIVDVEVQLGNVLATLQRYTAYMLDISLVSASATIALDLLLKVAEAASFYLLIASLVFWLLYMRFRHVKIRSFALVHRITRATILLFLILDFGVPITVFATAQISDNFEERRAAAHDHLDVLKSAYSADPDEKMHDHVKNVISTYKKSSKELHKHTHDTVQHASHYLLERLLLSLLVPLGLLLVFWLAIRSVLNHTIGAQYPAIPDAWLREAFANAPPA